jgi:hypothetical protein
MEQPLVILVYGDSLSLPRVPEGVSPQDIYAYKLEQWCRNNLGREVILYNRSLGGQSVDVLYEQYNSDTFYFGDFGEKVLIIQSGVVDCAPRPIPSWVRDILSCCPGRVREQVVRFLHHHRRTLLNMGLRWRQTSPHKFKHVYKKWVTRASASSTKVLLFNIVPTTDGIEHHSPGLGSSIKIYNQLIKEIVQGLNKDNVILLDVHEDFSLQMRGKNDLINTKDGHHLTVAGQEMYFRKIITVMSTSRKG